MTSLSMDAITALLEGDRKTSDPRPLPTNSPLEVLIQSDYCAMCLRENGPKVSTMYTVNKTPLCAAHAMYRLSLICVDNGYKVEVAGKVAQLPGTL